MGPLEFFPKKVNDPSSIKTKIRVPSRDNFPIGYPVFIELLSLTFWEKINLFIKIQTLKLRAGSSFPFRPENTI